MEKRSTFEIEKLDHYGRGITHYDGKVVFVENALPAEMVEIAITKEKSKYLEAKTTKIIKKNKSRCKVDCPYYTECGGCNLLHMSYSEQLKFKENKIEELINRLDPSIKQNKIISDQPFAYRNKATFQVKEKIGYYQSKTYEIIPIDKCLLIHPKMNELLQYLQKNIFLDGIEQIMIRMGIKTNDVMIVIKENKEVNKKEIYNKLQNKVKVLAFYRDGNYKFMTKEKSIVEKLEKYSFLISPSSFFQVNTEGAYLLYKEILKNINEKNNVLDLYCGTGTIGIFISSVANNVIGVEVNSDAIKDAKMNSKINHISNIEFICKSVSKLKERYKDIDVIIVDPPRAGLDKNSLTYIINYNVDKIIYVSCDPMTLMRDLKILSQKYKIMDITPVDMFPNTYHVETVTILHKREAKI